MAVRKRGKKANKSGASPNGRKEAAVAPSKCGKQVLSPSGFSFAEDRTIAISLALVAFLVYTSNGDFMFSHDATANIYLPIQMLRGKFSWTPEDGPPALFLWADANGTTVRMPFSLDDPPHGSDKPAREWLRDGSIQHMRTRYNMVPSMRDTREFVNTFNIGTGITFFPLVLVIAMAYGFDLTRMQINSTLLMHLGKIFASGLVAASGAFLFLAASSFPSVTRSQAIVITVAYLFGTCTWSLSSQTLWQHAPNEFYLSVTIWALVKAHRLHQQGKGWSARLGALCGFTVAMATMSRPTSAVIAMCIGFYLLFKRNLKIMAAYGGVGAVLGAFQLYYNYFYFGSPLEFGQYQAGVSIAREKTGSSNLWQTPVWKGASTLLISPSRGLFIYSPFMIFCMPAFYLVWLRFFPSGNAQTTTKAPAANEFEVLRPLCVSTVILWVIAFKFFDYWGGWCYGYRPIVDTMPLLAMMLCVTMQYMQKRRILWYLFLIMMVYSFYVQYLGAFAYDNEWNRREGVVFYNADGEIVNWGLAPNEIADLQQKYPDANVNRKQFLDIDNPEYRSRLWSWRDSPIVYYTNHFEKSRRVKKFKCNFIRKYF